MNPMATLHLFAGIGGFPLAVERVGFPFENTYCSEIDPYCNLVLKKNFPEMENLGDINEIDFEALKGKIGLLTGGPPCQPFSNAGLKLQEKDPRDLWPVTLDAIGKIKPTWCVLENVPAFTGSQSASGLYSFLENNNYLQWWFDIPAVLFGYPHIRRRILIVARLVDSSLHEFAANAGNDHVDDTHNPASIGFQEGDTFGSIRQEAEKKRKGGWERDGIFHKTWSPGAWVNHEPAVRRGGDGLSPRLRANIIKACGNAIVPEIAEFAFAAIKEFEETIQGEKNDTEGIENF